MTGPFSHPEGKSRGTVLLKNSALVAAMTELDGAREGVRAEGTKAMEELLKDFSKSARSSSTDREEGWNNWRSEEEDELPRVIDNRC